MEENVMPEMTFEEALEAMGKRLDADLAEYDHEGAKARMIKRQKAHDPNALSHWFPLVRDAGLPVPETVMLTMSDGALSACMDMIDCALTDDGRAELEAFAADIDAAARQVGYPAFLRTDHGSGKHLWERCCDLRTAEAIPDHIYGLVEWSFMVDFMVLPYRKWAVRERLPVKPLGVCENWEGMPIVRELRVFAEAGKVVCAHPYWPEHALEHAGAGDVDIAALHSMEGAGAALDIARRASEVVEGSWSVDLLDTERGWYLIDMAEAHRSYHWESCPKRKTAPPVKARP